MCKYEDVILNHFHKYSECFFLFYLLIFIFIQFNSVHFPIMRLTWHTHTHKFGSTKCWLNHCVAVNLCAIDFPQRLTHKILNAWEKRALTTTIQIASFTQNIDINAYNVAWFRVPSVVRELCSSVFYAFIFTL